MASRSQNLGIRQLETRAWYGHMSCPSRCTLRQEEFTFSEHPGKPTMRKPGFNSETQAKFCNVSGSNIVVRYSVGSILPFLAELLQGSTWTGWVIRCTPRSRRYLRTTVQFSKTTVPHSQLELFSHGLKSMKVNIILPGQHNHQIWTSLNHSSQFWRLRVGNRCPPATSLKELEDVLNEEWYKISVETVHNLYESILRRIAAVFKAKVVQHLSNKEVCTACVVFPLFYPTPVHSFNSAGQGSSWCRTWMLPRVWHFYYHSKDRVPCLLCLLYVTLEDL
jgi:hypothetical protein